MVTTLNITLDDTTAETARDVKDDLDLTWPEFISWATTQHTPTAPEPEPIPQEPSSAPTPPPASPESVTGLNVPGQGETAERRREAISRMYDYLREHGRAQKGEFLDLIEADEVRYASVESFWSNCIKGRDTLRALDGVNAPYEGASVWVYDDE